MTVTLPRGVLNGLSDIGALPNSKGLDRLVRARIAVSPHFSLQSSAFRIPLFLHAKSLRVLGHHQLAKTVNSVILVCSKLAADPRFTGREDDAIRTYLKRIHDYAFPKIVTEGPGWMFLCHLHALGGRRPWEKEKVRENIMAWVQPKKTLTDTFEHRQTLQSIFSNWTPKLNAKPRLSFLDFCQDPTRWGTAGGGPKSTIANNTYRTKWAWAWSHLLRDGQWQDVDIYAEAKKIHPDVAIVALKEEATKTREIITTPMASYLRQSYLAYLWGRPPINSPIGSSTWLPSFQAQKFQWYAAIDGKNFDHHIPLWFIISVLQYLGSVDDEAAVVAEAEIDHLLHLQVVTPSGEHIAYKGGVLSGWRLTALLDTLASEVIIRDILASWPTGSAFQTGTMGDDLVIASDRDSIPTSWLVEQYESHGMTTNASKTTAGRVGEFLRKIYAPSGILGYPALALKSICYASPWITTYDPNNPQELATNWLTWASRLLPLSLPNCQPQLTRFIQDQMKADLRRWGLKVSSASLDAAIRTPISAGGLGCVEWTDLSQPWCTLRNSKADRDTTFLSNFGISNVKKTFKTDYHPITLSHHFLADLTNRIQSTSGTDPPPLFPADQNISKILVHWFFDPSIPSVAIAPIFKFKLPRSLRVSGKAAILQYLLSGLKPTASLSSIQTTPEVSSTLTKTYRHVSQTILSSHRHATIKSLPAAFTLYQMLHRTSVECVRGTW